MREIIQPTAKTAVPDPRPSSEKSEESPMNYRYIFSQTSAESMSDKVMRLPKTTYPQNKDENFSMSLTNRAKEPDCLLCKVSFEYTDII